MADYLPSRLVGIQRSEAWARAFHGRLVMVSDSHVRDGRYLGVGVARTSFGGYWQVRVYTPDPIWTEPNEHGYTYPVSSRRWDWRERFPFQYFGYTWGHDQLSVMDVWDVTPSMLDFGRLVLESVEAAA